MNHKFEIFIRFWHNYICVLAKDIQLKQNQEIWGSYGNLDFIPGFGSVFQIHRVLEDYIDFYL